MVKNVIIQAGGRGSRMGRYTYNRPKCLISVSGINILQSVNIAFPKAYFTIIGDYKFEILRTYLNSIVNDFEYNLIRANGEGSIAGMNDAINSLNPLEETAITWSDLYYVSRISYPNSGNNLIALINSDKCRFSFYDGKIKEKQSSQNGIIGLFILKNLRQLQDS